MQFVRIAGIVPLGIGLTVISGLWLQPFGEFHSPPLFFRIFGTFAALPFVMIGVAVLFQKSIFKSPLERMTALHQQIQKSSPATNAGVVRRLDCPGCGAPLNSKLDVSPHGDAKCEHCDRWFNIHTER